MACNGFVKEFRAMLFQSDFGEIHHRSGVLECSVSVGNAAVLAVPDYFDYLAADPETAALLWDRSVALLHTLTGSE